MQSCLYRMNLYIWKTSIQTQNEFSTFDPSSPKGEWWAADEPHPGIIGWSNPPIPTASTPTLKHYQRIYLIILKTINIVREKTKPSYRWEEYALSNWAMKKIISFWRKDFKVCNNSPAGMCIKLHLSCISLHPVLLQHAEIVSNF